MQRGRRAGIAGVLDGVAARASRGAGTPDSGRTQSPRSLDAVCLPPTRASGHVASRSRIDASHTRRRDREADAKLADDTFRAAKAHNAELLRLEQEHDTQTALTTMRRAGMIAGVNPPRPDPREPPNETDVEILLRVKEKRPEEEEEEVREPENTGSRGARRAAIQKHRSKKKKQEESHFEIELKRFRTVEKIQGFKLGPIGVRYLVRDLVLGACPRLDTLDLGWNHIGRQGIKFLSDGFKRKCAPNLSRLDLRANLLMPNSIELLLEGLVKGQVKLKVLDLRANAFKDDGGCLIASLALEGCFETLEELHLESCEIRSRGMWALFQAFQAEARGKLFPSLQHVGLRHNRAAPETLRRMKNCPPWIAF
jgi:hypothetical protein